MKKKKQKASMLIKSVKKSNENDTIIQAKSMLYINMI